VVESPKKEEAKPKETLGQLEEKAGRAYVEAMNAHDAKKLASLYTDSAVVKVAGAPADNVGRDGIEKGYTGLFTAFPDFKTAPTRIWVKNDVVVAEWVMNGTHQGDLWGMKGTEKKVGLQGIDVMWFTPEGMIKEQHTYFDGATMFSQIGASPAKARPIPAIPTAPPTVVGMGAAGPDEAKNAAALDALTAALDGKKEADFLGGLADTVEYDDYTMPQGMKGKADGKKFFKEVTTGFPDAKHTPLNTWAVGDFVVSEGQMTGTHKGSFFGMAPTKKAVTLKSLAVFQLKDGKVTRGWNYANGADFMMQIGKMPAPKPAAAAAAGAKPGAAAPAAAGAKPADTKAPAKPADTKKP
jgi:steroid delta-isomerase-like uncharacterized protein